MDHLIVIISKDFMPNEAMEQFNYLIIRNNYTLIDHNRLLLNDKVICFDYLIIDDLDVAKS